MANPRKYTCRLLEMVDSGVLSADDVMIAAMSYMSDSDVEDMMHMNQWDDPVEGDDTEKDDSVEENDEDEITIGDTVNVDGGEYVAMQGPERWGCVGCAGNHNQLCSKLPDCDGLVFVQLPDCGGLAFVR